MKKNRAGNAQKGKRKSMRKKKLAKKVTAVILAAIMSLQSTAAYAAEFGEIFSSGEESKEEESFDSGSVSEDTSQETEVDEFSSGEETEWTDGTTDDSAEENTEGDTVQKAAVSAGDFTYEELNGSYIGITSYKGEETEVVIPSEIDGFTVQKISDRAFAGSSVKKVQIPDTVTVIGNSAFRNSSIESITIPNRVTSIENAAFMECTSMTTVTFGNSLKSLGEYVFYGCTGLTELQLPDSLKSYGYRTFANCSNLEKINYPVSLVSGADNAFQNDTKLTEITVPEGVSILASGAFQNASCLKKITLPAGLIKIGNAAFQGCSGLTEISIPDSVTEIGEYAFHGCTGIKELKLPDNLNSYGYCAFADCSNLEKINYPISLISGAADAFRDDVKLTEIAVPEGVETLAPGAFQNAGYLRKITLPAGLVKIGNAALQNCRNLREISIPDSTTEIGEYAFSGCSALKEAAFPQMLTTIGYRAFWGCTALEKISYPVGIVNAGSEIFVNCNSLVRVEIPEGVIAVPDRMFENAGYLEQIMLPSTLQTIGSFSFGGCRSLDRITLPSSVTSVGYRAFQNCENLKKIWIGSKMTSMNESFYNCDKNSLVIYGEKSSYAEEWAKNNGFSFMAGAIDQDDAELQGCVKDKKGRGINNVLVMIYDKAGQRTEGKIYTDADGRWKYAKAVPGKKYRIYFQHELYRFENSYVECTVGNSSQTVDMTGTRIYENEEADGAENFTYDVIDGNDIRITAYKGNGNKVVIPEEIDGYIVKELGNSVFENNQSLKEIVLPSGMEKLGTAVFRNCKMLTTVRFNAALKEIGNASFQGCTAMSRIDFPIQLNRIGEYAFYGCTGLTELQLPDSLTSYEYRAFADCSNLEKINYPISLTSGAFGAFQNDTKLTEITVPEGVKTLAPGAFQNASCLKKITLPAGLTKIGNAAFQDCTGLTEIDIPDSVTEIGEYAFQDCRKVKKLILPDGLKCYGYRAFSDCELLESINYPLKLEEGAANAFQNDRKLLGIIIPDGVEMIAPHAFNGASYLQNVQLPDSLKKIKNAAFQNCSELREILIPDGVVSLEEYAFYGCSTLKEVQLPDSVTFMGYRTFSNCTALRKIHYPAGLVQAEARCFENCSSLKKMEIPEGVTALPDSIFDSAAYLTDIVLPSTLTTIGQFAFTGCSALERLILPDSVTSVKYRAFENCTSLTKIWIGRNVKEISDGFRNCDKNKLTIYGEANTYAQQWAEENGFNFVAQRLDSEDALIYGKVTDQTGKGVEKVFISIYNKDERKTETQTYTDSDGKWNYNKAVKGRNYRIYFWHEEYQFQVAYIDSTADGSAINITGTPNYEKGQENPQEDFEYSKINGNDIRITKFKGTGSKVVIPTQIEGYTVKELGNSVFANNQELKEIILPSELTTIGAAAFKNCTILTTVRLGANTEYIGNEAFRGCTSMKEIQLPIQLKGIGEYAFYECTGLTELHLPDTLNYYNYRAFAKCANLKKINYPLSLNSGADNVFEEDRNLTEITVPEGVETLASHAFHGASYLQKVALPDSLQAIGNAAFEGCSGISQIQIPEHVTSIGEYAFYGCTGIKELVLPDGLESYGYRAFAGCDALEKINYPKSLTSGADNAFQGDKNLTEIIVPEGVETLAPHVFHSASCLQNIKLPDSLKTIGNAAFEGCSGITQINIPDQVASVGEYAFAGCTGLKEMILPDSVENIGYRAFADCTELTSCSYPMNLKMAGSDIWSNNRKLKKIVIPEGVTKIPDRTFQNASYLRYVILPATLKTIGTAAFEGCKGLPEIELNSGLTQIGEYSFADCDGLITVKIPETVTQIGYRAFAQCRNLVYVSALGNGLTELKNQAFDSDASLNRIDIPESTVTIEDHVFDGCSNVVIYCKSTAYAAEYAIKHNIPVYITDGDNKDGKVLNTEKSYYTTNTMGSSGYVDLIASYELKEEVKEKVSKMQLQFVIPSDMTLLEQTIMVGGKRCTDYTFGNSILSVPVKEAAQTVRFSLNPSKSRNLFTLAKLSYTYEGQKGTDFIDCIDSDLPVMTLEAPSEINKAEFEVSGTAPGSSKVNFYIDGKACGTASSSKAGKYSKNLKLSNPKDDTAYKIKVTTETESGIIEQTASVVYSEQSPVLEELKLYYWGHDSSMNYYNRVFDLTDKTQLQNTITFNPNYEYTFTVKMSNREKINNLYVTSTRNGTVKYLKAEWNNTKGCYVTSGKFDGSNSSYVPGTIGVKYNLTYDEIKNMKDEDAGHKIINDYKKQHDFSDEKLKILSSDENSLSCVATLKDGNQITYEYNDFSARELYEYLLKNGYVQNQGRSSETEEFSAGGNGENFSAGAAFDISDLLKDIAKEYTVNGVKYYVLHTEDNRTDYLTIQYDGITDTFKTWVFKSSIKTIAEDDLAYYLFSEFGDMTPTESASSVIDFAYDAGKATYKYMGKMWELDMQIRPGMSEAQKQAVQDARNLATTVLLMRYFGAFLDMAAGAEMSTGNVGAWAACWALSKSLGYVADLLEEKGWAGARDSLIETFITTPLTWIIDPSGYVYEAVTDNRLSDVTATVYYKDKNGKSVLWNAQEYDQNNPVMTDMDGTYSWDVPEGTWQVKYEKEGYETAYSDWMEVPPPQTEVHISMRSTQKPEVLWTETKKDYVTIRFTKYMTPDMINTVVLKDAQDKNISYTLEYDTSQTSLDGTVYADTYTFRFKDKTLKTGEACSINIPGTVTSYSQIAVKPVKYQTRNTGDMTLSVPENIQTACGGITQFDLKLNGEAGSEVDNLTPEIMSSFEEFLQIVRVQKTGTGTWKIAVKGIMQGEAAVIVKIPGTSLRKDIKVTIQDTGEVHQHSYGGYKTTRRPTVFKAGEKVKTCSVCGYEKKVSIAKLKPVLKVNVSSITLKTRQQTSGLKITMAKGDKVTSWKSADTKIVKVSGNGKLTAQKKKGTTTVTVKLKSGLSKKIKVKVQSSTVKTTKISGLPKNITLKKRKTTTLKPVLTPFTAGEKITYVSSDKKRVSVSSKGVVKGLRAGKAKITVKSGKQKITITVTVK